MEDASGFLGKERKMQQKDSDHPFDRVKKFTIPRKGQKTDGKLKEKEEKPAAVEKVEEKESEWKYVPKLGVNSKHLKKTVKVVDREKTMESNALDDLKKIEEDEGEETARGKKIHRNKAMDALKQTFEREVPVKKRGETSLEMVKRSKVEEERSRGKMEEEGSRSKVEEERSRSKVEEERSRSFQEGLNRLSSAGPKVARIIDESEVLKDLREMEGESEEEEEDYLEKVPARERREGSEETGFLERVQSVGENVEELKPVNNKRTDKEESKKEVKVKENSSKPVKEKEIGKTGKDAADRGQEKPSQGSRKVVVARTSASSDTDESSGFVEDKVAARAAAAQVGKVAVLPDEQPLGKRVPRTVLGVEQREEDLGTGLVDSGTAVEDSVKVVEEVAKAPGRVEEPISLPSTPGEEEGEVLSDTPPPEVVEILEEAEEAPLMDFLERVPRKVAATQAAVPSATSPIFKKKKSPRKIVLTKTMTIHDSSEEEEKEDSPFYPNPPGRAMARPGAGARLAPHTPPSRPVLESCTSVESSGELWRPGELVGTVVVVVGKVVVVEGTVVVVVGRWRWCRK